LKRHKGLLYPGIEKTTKWLREKYYYIPDYQKLIQNIINESEICNIAKTEHRNTKLPFELAPEIKNIREQFVMDFYMVGNQQFLSSIDAYSKFDTPVKVTGRDWIEAKRDIMKLFNEI